MEKISDHQSDGCVSGSENYSPSADISESDCSSSLSCRRYDRNGSTSLASSPFSLSGQITPLFPAPSPFMLPAIDGKDVVVWDEKRQKSHTHLSEMEMMKERFSKLLLGEDMSGGGKGVCTALAISNAITNLSATVFGELWRLEPLSSQKKKMWSREMEWLLCVSDSIVELVPSVKQFPCGGTYEIMTARPRLDLYINLPALKKLDAMLINILDSFQANEFWYVDRGIVVKDDEYSSTKPLTRQEEKWWLPYPKVPSKGLSEEARKKLQKCRDCTNQIWKAALAINTNVLSEMEIPSAYLETLPKNGKACLGDTMYREITAERFSPECVLDCLDLSSEHETLEIANRIEAAMHVWEMKDRKSHPNPHNTNKHKSWGGKVKGIVVDGDKNHILAKRAQVLLRSLRIRFPSLPQTALDMHKIQYNKDVGQSILESYSRVTESLAFNIMARIDDVLYVDDDVTNRCAESVSILKRVGVPIQKRMSPSPFSIQHTPYASPFATPTFCLSPPLAVSPKKGVPMPVELDKLWSYAGNLNATRVTSDPPERD